jgi:hypothetical protein
LINFPQSDLEIWTGKITLEVHIDQPD